MESPGGSTMLYDSDSSVQDDDNDELLSNHNTNTDHGNQDISQDIFTIQLDPDDQDVTPRNIPSCSSKSTHRYSHLDTQEEDEHPQLATTSYSQNDLHSVLNPKRKPLPTFLHPSKSDSHFNYITKNCFRGNKQDVEVADNEFLDSDDEASLTSGRGQRQGSYRGRNPGGSSLFSLSVWSTYSELLLEHNGFSLSCCYACIVQLCMSAQCNAYTKALKMFAWAVILILVLMCLKRYFYNTAFHRNGYSDYSDRSSVENNRQHLFMDMLHGKSSKH